MLRLEDFMEIQKLHHDGWSVTEIARHLDIDRKTVRKYLREAPREYERKAKSWKIDPWRAWLRERWEQGVHNASRLFGEMRKRGYDGCYTQVKRAVREWRSEGRERAFVRFETAPGEQAQMDWGHFGNWGGSRLYGFALTLGWSRMQYVEFTRRQDVETLLNSMVHAFRYFGGVTATVLTDNMKTVVVERIDGQPRFHAKMLDFASYHGFVPRVCHPYRPETKGKIESTICYIKSSFWPGLQFDSLAELNRQALVWCDEVNRRVHGTTREVPLERFAREGLTPLNGQPDYDTSYVSHRQAGPSSIEFSVDVEAARRRSFQAGLGAWQPPYRIQEYPPGHALPIHPVPETGVRIQQDYLLQGSEPTTRKYFPVHGEYLSEARQMCPESDRAIGRP